MPQYGVSWPELEMREKQQQHKDPQSWQCHHVVKSLTNEGNAKLSRFPCVKTLDII